MSQCGKVGLYGDHVIVRMPGIWRDRDGSGGPVVHCGDVIFTPDGEAHRAGQKLAGQVWAASPPVPRPGLPCDKSTGETLLQDIQRLWSFRQAGGPHILMGLLGTGYLGLAARWRPNGFLTGENGSGKTLLMDVLRAAAPLHYYSNNTTEAGVNGAVNGHVMPIFLDEATDRPEGAERLLELVVASSSQDGTKGSRGTADGKVRTFESAGVVLYGSILPPVLQPQHMARITLVELTRPANGEDARAEMETLIESTRQIGPALWARALRGWHHWRGAFEAFRARLSEIGCAAREMDQMGALLAGWWILTRDGAPTSRDAIEGVGAIMAFVRTAEDVATESGPRRAISYLLSQRVQYDGTTRQDQIAALLERAFDGGDDQDGAVRALQSHGLRPILPCLRKWRWMSPDESSARKQKAPSMWIRDPGLPIGPVDERGHPADRCVCINCVDRQRRPVPRVSDSGGVWLMPQSVSPLFRGQRGLEDGRWAIEILRLPSALRAKKAVMVNGVVGKAIWIPREDIDPNVCAPLDAIVDTT